MELENPSYVRVTPNEAFELVMEHIQQSGVYEGIEPSKGKSADGELLESGEDYKYRIPVDEFVEELQTKLEIPSEVNDAEFFEETLLVELADTHAQVVAESKHGVGNTSFVVHVTDESQV